MSIIFLFLDGVGLAPAHPDNPLSDAPMPQVRALLGGPLTVEHVQAQDGLLLKPLDATLGVPGLPQSGTGHTALLAGVNAATLHGRHQAAFPPVALRSLLAEQSIFRRVVERGERAAFANAFGSGYWEAVAARRVRRSASVIAAEGAGLRFRTLDDLRAGRALAWDITGAALQSRWNTDVPLVTPEQAGGNLARLADEYDFVFFECFLTDFAGHGRGDLSVEAALTTVDALIGGVLAAKRATDTLLITSDHGNIESRSTPAHTLNPVPLLVVGPGAPAFAAVQDIAGVVEPIIRSQESGVRFPSTSDS